MAFEPSPAAWPHGDAGPDARLSDLFAATGDIQVAGIPTDAAVIGRKGAKDGPTGIREAFRFIGGHDTTTGRRLHRTICDHGDIAGLDAFAADIAAMHEHVRQALRPIMGTDTILLGGDHGLTYAHVRALADATQGSIGIVVVDAHYDLRGHDVQPTSGTPFRRIIEALPDRVAPQHIVEIGIRPLANAPSLAAYADEQGVQIHSSHDVHERGVHAVLDDTMDALDVDHLWLSIDIDGLDQSIASGCSAPGAGGLTWMQAEAIVRRIAGDPRCRGMDILEVAPGLDSTGNTCRTAAQLVGTYLAARS